MKTKISCPIVLLLIFACNFAPPSKTRPKTKVGHDIQTFPDDKREENIFLKKAVQAAGVAIISKNNEYQGFCTVFVVDKVENKYRFITAAHCISDYEGEQEVDFSEYEFSIRTEDAHNESNYITARALFIADKKDLKDILVLEGESPVPLPTLSLAQNEPEIGEGVYLITMRQFELGMQVFEGYVSRVAVTNDIIIGTLNLKSALVLHIPALGRGQGASGSAVISQKTHEVIGIFFASSEYEDGDHTAHLAVPAEKIRYVYSQVK